MTVEAIEMKVRKIQTIDDLTFPMFRPDQIKYLEELKYLYERDRLMLVPENEEDFNKYKLQFNSLKSMELVLGYLIDQNTARRENQIIDMINPTAEELEMKEYFRHDRELNNSVF